MSKIETALLSSELKQKADDSVIGSPDEGSQILFKVSQIIKNKSYKPPPTLTEEHKIYNKVT